ncbi:uncharacterized protein LOC100897310 [Galendromus occidentalis]|uniref:Uncharacterized protein LOC100897310 n=1 Tax=Galendromus occidentalis TaxID=34638 RepID=A0AAJ6QT96_9ACAR|nr:uncharacterized protein LOC100897310 [Galendromus occidentalis]
MNGSIFSALLVLTAKVSFASSDVPGGDLLQRRCRGMLYKDAFSNLINPVNRKSCAFFAGQDAYLPYELKIEAGDSGTKLIGNVSGVGSYEASMVTCGTDSRCLRIEKSPGDKINGAYMFYSNAAIELSDDKNADVSYVASLDCNNGEPGLVYFEIRRELSQEEIMSIKQFYGISLDSAKLSDCLRSSASDSP